MTAYEMRISDWSSDVCSSDLIWKNLENVKCPFVGFIQVYPWRQAGGTVRISGHRSVAKGESFHWRKIALAHVLWNTNHSVIFEQAEPVIGNPQRSRIVRRHLASIVEKMDESSVISLDRTI